MDSQFQTSSEIASYLNCEPLTARILWARGLRTTQAVDALFTTDLSGLLHPNAITDMARAVSRVADAVEKGEPIVVYGDYDVDGTCGSSILFDFFRQVGVTVKVYQPNRFSEGYGVHVAAIERLCEEGARVILTVDCGITAVDPANAARDRGVDMIIIDHHKLGERMPDAFAVIDPQRPDDESGLKNVCGAGLAFFFAMGLRAELRTRGYFAKSSAKEPNLLRLLDLVAVATIADVVDVRGVNRILVSHGLRVMRTQPRPGLRAILEAASVAKPTSMHCGFVIGPRINAAGRLKTARTAFELLTTEDYGEALAMAQELEKFNTDRRATQEDVWISAREQAYAMVNEAPPADLPAAMAGPWPRALVLANPEWHEGVVGIVASKLVEEFSRPVFVLTASELKPGAFKGSIRSVAKIDILSVISTPSVSKHLLNFGGHAHAGGVTLEQANLDAFRRAVNEHLVMTTDHTHYERDVFFDVDAEPSEITEKFLVEIENLEPFGHQFPEPVLRVRGLDVQDFRVLKEKHLKLRVKGPRGFGVDAIWFNAISKDPSLSKDSVAQKTFYLTPQWNEWQGSRKLQLRIHNAL